jgi:hypothetical protein
MNMFRFWKSFGRALWRGVFAATLVGAALFFTVGVYLAHWPGGLFAGILNTLLFALPAGLFAFLWALRPEAAEKDRHGTP